MPQRRLLHLSIISIPNDIDLDLSKMVKNFANKKLGKLILL